jgi:hypothetical protein
MKRRSIEVGRGHADEGASEVAVFGVAAAFVGEKRRVEHRTGFLPVAAGPGGVEELQHRTAHFETEAYRPLLRQGNRLARKNDVAIGPRGGRRHDQQLALAVGVGGNHGVVEIVARIVAGEAGELALVGRREIERHFGS